jgi:hypothetical protein
LQKGMAPTEKVAPKKIDARKTAIGYKKKTATAAKDGKGDREDQEVPIRASQSPSSPWRTGLCLAPPT